MRNTWKMVFAIAAALMSATCGGGKPASQIWAVSFAPDCGLGSCGTNVTVLDGGAISQRDPSTRVTNLTGTCSYAAPISGQWSGTIFKFTMSGGCGGEQMLGFTQGEADAEYGNATSATGTITWSFNNSKPITQTWTAFLVN